MATPLVIGFMAGWWAHTTQAPRTAPTAGPPIGRYIPTSQGLLLVDSTTGETWNLSATGWTARAEAPRLRDRIETRIERMLSDADVFGPATNTGSVTDKFGGIRVR